MARQKKLEKTEKKNLMDILMAANNNGSGNASIIEESDFFNNVEYITTDVPMLNVAFSGKVDGGFFGGLTTIAGPSRHFKSSFGLVAMKAFLDKYEDGFVMFYDSEGGITTDYLRSFGIDTRRVVHCFVSDVETLKHLFVTTLDELDAKSHVMFFVDSLGNLSSKREHDNAVNQNTAADFTRAKEIKSLTRLINSKLKLKRIPCIMINHSYKTMELYSKDVVGGGTGVMYSSDVVLVVGSRSQEKSDDKTLAGWNFTITVDKSRLVKERVKVPIRVTFDKGISKYSGLSEVATDLGVISRIRGRGISYVFKNKNGLEVVTSEENIDIDETFWSSVFEQSNLKELIEKTYTLGGNLDLISSSVKEDTGL